MPFMIGRAPVRRTVKYLNAGKLYLKNRIQIFAINYNTDERLTLHKGIRDFVFWFLPQVQYKSPHVNVYTLTDMTPSPFITCFYDNGKRMIIDVEGRTKEEILKHLINVVGKSEDVLQNETVLTEKKDNPANFGAHCEKSCICTIDGQLPCPYVVPLPKFMIRKRKDEFDDDE